VIIARRPCIYEKQPGILFLHTFTVPALKVSTATCAAALELPNLNYVQGLN